MRQLKGLDLFSGLGGWSDGLAMEGFDVTGVEIESKIAALYKHKVIVADVCELNPENFKGYDLIVGSPPCRDFSHMARVFFARRWKTRKADPEGEGMRLINAFLSFVNIAKPKYWLMENVPGLLDYIDLKPRCVSYLTPSMRRVFFGNFPGFFVPVELGRKMIMDIGGPLRSWERARIPLPVARALGVAVRQALE